MASLVDVVASVQTAVSAVEALFSNSYFATFGTLEIRIVSSPESFVSERTYGFALHDTVGGFPRQQWMGENLETIELRFGFHVNYADPLQAVGYFKKRANSHVPQALVFANGIYRGEYIVTRIGEDITYTTGDGTPLAIVLSVSLREWAPESAEELQKRRVESSTEGANQTRVLGLSLRDAALAARTIAINAAQHLAEDNVGQSMFIASPPGIPVGAPFTAASNPSSPSYVSPSEAVRRG